MADQEAGIGGGRSLVQRRHIVGEARVAEVGGRAEQVERRRYGSAGRERREAYPAVAGDHRGDTLAGLGRHVRVHQQQVVVVGVGVDEARRDDAPGGVDGARGLCACQITDGGDAVGRDGDIGALARRARAVDHRAAREEDVVPLFRRHRRLPLLPTVAGGTMTAAAGRDNRLWSLWERLVWCRSMKEELRPIPSDDDEREPAPTTGLGTALHALFRPLGSVELEFPPREPMREPPRFD